MMQEIFTDNNFMWSSHLWKSSNNYTVQLSERNHSILLSIPKTYKCSFDILVSLCVHWLILGRPIWSSSSFKAGAKLYMDGLSPSELVTTRNLKLYSVRGSKIPKSEITSTTKPILHTVYLMTHVHQPTKLIMRLLISLFQIFKR